MKLDDKTLLKTSALINGEWVSSDTGDLFPVKNPATGDIITQVSKSSANQTKRAIEVSAVAMEDWKNLPAKARANFLRTWFELMIENQEDLAKIMTAEQGKTLAESRGEIAYGPHLLNGLESKLRGSTETLFLVLQKTNASSVLNNQSA